MEKIASYRVTVLAWDKHNGSKKRGHTYFMVSPRLVDDDKLLRTSSRARLLYVWMLSRCADEVRATIEWTPSQPRVWTVMKPSELHDALLSLEKNQLVKIEKIELLYKCTRKEETLQDKKRKELPEGSSGPPPAALEDEPKIELELTPSEPPSPKKPAAKKTGSATTDTNRKVWESYRTAYLKRWKVEPTRNQVVNSAIASFVKRVGEADAPKVIVFFVEHNDSLYLKSCHDIKLALRDAEGLRTQWQKGRAITGKDARDFEKSSHYQDQLNKIEAGEI